MGLKYYAVGLVTDILANGSDLSTVWYSDPSGTGGSWAAWPLLKDNDYDWNGRDDLTLNDDLVTSGVITDVETGGLLTLNTTAYLVAMTITNAKILVAEYAGEYLTPVVIMANIVYSLDGGSAVDIGYAAYVHGHGSINNSGGYDSNGIYINGGTITEWHGAVTCSGSGVGVYSNSGIIDLWYGNVACNSIDTGIGVLNYGGDITAWYGSVTNSDSGYGVINVGDIVAWYGNVTESGDYGYAIYNESSGTITAWYGDVVLTGSGTPVYNDGGTITAWYYGDEATNVLFGSYGIIGTLFTSAVDHYAQDDVEIHAGADMVSSVWNSAANGSGTWLNQYLPGFMTNCDLNGYELTSDSPFSCAAVTDGVGGGLLTLNTGADFTATTVTDANIIIDGGTALAPIVFTGNIECNLASGNVVEIGVSAYVEGHGNVTQSVTGTGVNNGGTITAWYGDVTNSNAGYGVQNGGTISAWYGDVTNFDAGYGIMSTGTITAWYGDVIQSGSGFGVGVGNSSTIGVWSGNIINSSTGTGVSNDSIITAWYGDVTQSGVGWSVGNNGTITNWYYSKAATGTLLTSYSITGTLYAPFPTYYAQVHYQDLNAGTDGTSTVWNSAANGSGSWFDLNSPEYSLGWFNCDWNGKTLQALTPFLCAAVTDVATGGLLYMYTGSSLTATTITDAKLHTVSGTALDPIVINANINYNLASGYGVVLNNDSFVEGHGDVSNSSAGTCIHVDGVVTWYGDVTNTGSGKGVYNWGGEITAWYGNVINQGSGWCVSNYSASLTAWYGNVSNSGSGRGVSNVNSNIYAWYGSVASTGDGVGVYNNYLITAWYGNVTESGSGVGVHNYDDGTITVWYGDVAESGTGVGVTNSGTVTDWYYGKAATEALLTSYSITGTLYTAVPYYAQISAEIHAGTNEASSVWNDDAGGTGNWLNIYLPGFMFDCDWNGKTLTSDSPFECSAVTDAATDGLLTLNAGADFTATTITNAKVLVAGGTALIPTVFTADVMYTLVSGVAVEINTGTYIEGHGNIANSSSGYGILNGGTIVVWYGNVTEFGAGSGCGVYNGGTISAWYGDVVDSNSGFGTGVANYGTITSWYGNVTNSESGDAVVNDISGNIITWHGNVTNSGSGSGVSNSGTITAWYGNVIESSGYDGVNNVGTITAWYGNVQLTGDGDNGVYNSNGTIVAWYGNVTNSGTGVCVNNTGTIVAWYGDVTQSSSGTGVDNSTGDIIAWYGNVTESGSGTGVVSGIVTAWYGNVTASGTGKGVDNAGTITVWCGDVTESDSGLGITNTGVITAWYGNVTESGTGLSTAIENGGDITWYGDITVPGAGDGVANIGTFVWWWTQAGSETLLDAYSVTNDAQTATEIAIVQAAKQTMIYGGLIDHPTYSNPLTSDTHTHLPGYYANLAIGPTERVLPEYVLSGTKLWRDDPVDITDPVAAVDHVGTLDLAASNQEAAALEVAARIHDNPYTLIP